MRFEGPSAYNGQPGKPIGVGGLGDSAPFGEVATIPGGPYFITPHTLFGVDEQNFTAHRLVSVTAPETLAREPKLIGELLYVITNERIIAYVKPAQGAPAAMLEEKFSVQLPGPFSDLERIDIASLLDATLISFSFGRGMASGAGEATQTIMLVEPAGRARQVAQRQLTHDFPAVFEHHDWWISPVLHTVLALPDALLDRGMVLDHGKVQYFNELEKERPPAAWLAALLAASLSGLYAVYWLRRLPVSAGRKIGWIACSVLLGPPALASLLVLQRRKHGVAAGVMLPSAHATPA